MNNPTFPGKFFFIVAVLLFVAVSCNRQTAIPRESERYRDATATLAGRRLQIELAETAEEQVRGLSGRDSITDEQAMLFVLSDQQQSGFWMKDMKFAIDLIWLKDSRVSEIAPNLAPQPGIPDWELPVYFPQKFADSVLEVKAGWTKRYNLQIGDEFLFEPIELAP